MLSCSLDLAQLDSFVLTDRNNIIRVGGSGKQSATGGTVEAGTAGTLTFSSLTPKLDFLLLATPKFRIEFPL